MVGDVFISPFVVKEINRGDAEAARLRREAVRGIPELPATPNAEALAAALLAEGAVPEVARTDAAHIAGIMHLTKDRVLRIFAHETATHDSKRPAHRRSFGG